MLHFHHDVQIAYNKAFAAGVVTDTPQEIIEIIMDQEIVSYCTENGSISFDYNDVDWEV
jgi:hypothetical protein